MVTALVVAPLVLGAIWAGKWAVFVVVLLIVGLAAYELSRALELPFSSALIPGVLPVVLSGPYATSGILAGVILSLPWTLLSLAASPAARRLESVLALLLMAVWVGVPMAHVPLIASQQNSFVLVLIAVAGPWVSDAGAYFSGHLFGRHLLFPSLSPNKTIEGAMGGIVLTTLVIGGISYYFLSSFFLLASALAGIAVSLFSQSGDLFESLLKRLLDVKDLGAILPGHGGILDRIDSLLFTAPSVYYIVLLHGSL
jgi:phosphatidate cytidylyltransferase